MPEWPTGTVSLLFTDIDGSTRLLQRLGDRYGDALAQHRRLVREAIASYRGQEVDNQGDAIFAAFRPPGTPLRRRWPRSARSPATHGLRTCHCEYALGGAWPNRRGAPLAGRRPGGGAGVAAEPSPGR
jgi:class 3 adenylate cyclase